MSARYAIYFAPALQSPWWQFGSHWLGRDESRDQVLVQPEITGMSGGELHGITAAPRRYGFHATLKAPFVLHVDAGVAELQSRLRDLAGTLRPVALGALQACTLGDFVALVPAQPPDALAELASRCVRDLDDLRHPLTDADLARRRADTLDARGLELLHQYGYPHVLERFRLHFSLTGPVASAQAQAVMEAVQNRVEQLNRTAPLVLDRLCLFVEPGVGHAFTRMLDVELAP